MRAKFRRFGRASTTASYSAFAFFIGIGAVAAQDEVPPPPPVPPAVAPPPQRNPERTPTPPPAGQEGQTPPPAAPPPPPAPPAPVEATAPDAPTDPEHPTEVVFVDEAGGETTLVNSEVIIDVPQAGEESIEAVPAGGAAQVEGPVVPSRAESGTPQVDSTGFIKGDLTHPGTRELLSRYDHFGVRVGGAILDSNLFLAIDPGAAFYWEKFAIALHAPLNLLALEGGTLEYGGLKVRREDWDEVPDYARVVRFVTYGRKEQDLYFTVNTMRPMRLGHGVLIDKYQGNIDVDRTLTGVIFDGRLSKYGGWEFKLNDITFTNRLIGGLLYFKPLSLVSDNKLLRSLSLGGEYVADFKAPRCVRVSQDSDDCVQARGHVAEISPGTGEPLDNTFVRTDKDTGRYVVKEEAVSAAGFSGEMKVIYIPGSVDVKVYGTYHKFLNDGGGAGQAAGVLWRLNAGDALKSAFRIRTEYRTFDDGFIPAYFDTLYEANKYEYALRPRAHQLRPTKYQSVFGDPKNGFERSKLGRRHGYRLEASWGLYRGQQKRKQIAMAAGIQDATGENDAHFFAHLEFPALQFLQLFGTYMRTNEGNIGGLFTDPLESHNAVIMTGLRLSILPFLFLNASYSRSLSLVRSPGSEYHLGNDTVVDSNGQSWANLPQDRLFENVPTLAVQLEFGWEFDEPDEPAKSDESGE